MRTGTIVAIAVAGIIAIGGIVRYNSSSDQARLDAERTVPTAAIARDETQTTGQEEQAASSEIAREQEAAREVEAAEARAADDATTRQEAASGPAHDNLAVGGGITEDAAAAESDSPAAALVDPDSADSTAGMVDDAQAADADAPRDTATGTADTATGTADTAAGTADTATGTADTATGTADTATGSADTGTQEAGARLAAADATEGAADGSAGQSEPEQTLRPESFDREAVLALIEDSEQLNDEQRASLQELVEVASTTPDMVENAIETIRNALDPPSVD